MVISYNANIYSSIYKIKAWTAVSFLQTIKTVILENLRNLQSKQVTKPGGFADDWRLFFANSIGKIASFQSDLSPWENRIDFGKKHN